MGGTCSTCGSDEECLKILTGKPERKRPLGRPSSKSGGNIRVDHRDIV
jgi:hypothetical protein